MICSTGKVVTLKDITNIQTEIHQGSDSNNLDTLVQCLKDMEGMSPLHKKLFYSSLFIQVLQLNFTLMMRMSLQDFFQDCIMKAMFSSYPALIMVVSYIPSKSILLLFLIYTIIEEVGSELLPSLPFPQHFNLLPFLQKYMLCFLY